MKTTGSGSFFVVVVFFPTEILLIIQDGDSYTNGEQALQNL